RPSVSFAIASIASLSRMLTEWVTGRSVPSLYLSGCLSWARAGGGSAPATPASAPSIPAFKASRRVMFVMCGPRSVSMMTAAAAARSDKHDDKTNGHVGCFRARRLVSELWPRRRYQCVIVGRRRSAFVLETGDHVLPSPRNRSRDNPPWKITAFFKAPRKAVGDCDARLAARALTIAHLFAYT